MFLEFKNTTFQSITSKILHFVTPLILQQGQKLSTRKDEKVLKIGLFRKRAVTAQWCCSYHAKNKI